MVVLIISKTVPANWTAYKKEDGQFLLGQNDPEWSLNSLSEYSTWEPRVESTFSYEYSRCTRKGLKVSSSFLRMRSCSLQQLKAIVTHWLSHYCLFCRTNLLASRQKSNSLDVQSKWKCPFLCFINSHPRLRSTAWLRGRTCRWWRHRAAWRRPRRGSSCGSQSGSAPGLKSGRTVDLVLLHLHGRSLCWHLIVYIWFQFLLGVTPMQKSNFKFRSVEEDLKNSRAIRF